MSKPKHCHPMALVMTLATTFKSFAFIFLIAFFNRDSFQGYFPLVAASLVFMIIGLASLIYWYRTYDLQSNQLVIHHGVLVKHHTTIPYDNIQTISQRQWFFLKPFHLVSLTIETAGGQADDSEAVLAAVPESLLKEINTLRRRDATDPVAEVDALPVVSNDTTVPHSNTLAFHLANPQILLFSVTDLSLFASSLFLFGLGQNFLPDSLTHWLGGEVDALLQAGIVVMVSALGLLLLLLILISIARNFNRFYNFTLWREGDTLHIERGLFQRHTQAIPIAKIQGLVCKQQLLRQVCHLTSVDLLMATQAGSEEEAETAFNLLPIIRQKELDLVLAQVLPEWQFEADNLQQPSQHLIWYFIRWPLGIGLISTAVASYFNLWLAGAFVLLTLLALVSGYLKAHYQGYQLMTNHRLLFQEYHLLTKHQTLLESQRIQAIDATTSKWLLAKDLSHVTVHLRVGNQSEDYGLHFLPQADSHALQAFCRQRGTYK